MPALGTTVEWDRRQNLSRFEYYLRLADALSNRADDSGHLKQLAHSFGHDVLNLATLAGQLLWYEGVTPDMWRSHDLVAVAVDAESYFVMLQTACDIMADVVATLGAKPGQAPFDSFHRLNEWAIRHPGRLKPEFRLLASKLPWFVRINNVRTKLVHRGGDAWVYTERIPFEWDIWVSGQKVNRGKLLLSTLQNLTISMLEFSAVLAELVLPRRALSLCAKKTVISGVYVPALYHLLQTYRIPSRRNDLQSNARMLAVCGGYVEAARLGYPDGFWWQTLLNVSKGLGVTPSSGIVPVSASGQVHDCKFVFTKDGKSYGVIACDEILGNEKWLRGAAESATRFLDIHKLTSAVLIGQVAQGNLPNYLPGSRVTLTVGGDALRAATAAIVALKS